MADPNPEVACAFSFFSRLLYRIREFRISLHAPRDDFTRNAKYRSDFSKNASFPEKVKDSAALHVQFHGQNWFKYACLPSFPRDRARGMCRGPF